MRFLFPHCGGRVIVRLPPLLVKQHGLMVENQFDPFGDGRQRPARMEPMEPNSKTSRTSTIVWSLVWALAVIAAAFFFKGNPAEYWIESALIVGALTFVVLKRRSASAR